LVEDSLQHACRLRANGGAEPCLSRAAAAVLVVLAACVPPAVRVVPTSSVTPPRPAHAAALTVTLSEGNDEPLSGLVRTVTLTFGRACTQDTSAPAPWSLVLDVTIERRPVDVAIVGVVTQELHGAPPGCADALTQVYLSGTWPNGAGIERYRVRIAYE